MRNRKRGQVTIFIIIAVVIVAATVAYFVFRGGITNENVPASLQPAYTSFLACLSQDTQTGISVLESQGGYIYLPEFEPGSKFMPFSSQLNFLGNPIPYWYYVSGSNVAKEQVPSKSDMEDQLGKYISEKINGCSLKSYYDQGFEISWTDPKAQVTISANKVDVQMKAELTISHGEDSAVIGTNNIEVESQIGGLYDSAREVYNQEQKNMFLEKYGIDTLRLYAPVDGVEVTCGPLVWNANKVFSDVKNAIETNTLELKEGSSNDYFTIDFGKNVNGKVRFLNSKNWSNTFEVSPSEGPLMVSNPVGNQPGLGVLGFCYVPYHYVYDMKYPVLAQISDGGETFQFPIAVVIQGNNPRVSLNATAIQDAQPDLCTNKNTEVQVNTKDNRGMPVQSDISYECFGNRCAIGETSATGVLKDEFPQCANGYVVASAQGFKPARYLFSTVKSGSVDVILDKLYTKNVQLSVDGVNYNGNAIITFSSADDSKTVAYPEQKTVQLGEGQYEVQVYIYKNSSIKIGATTTRQCVDVPRSGLLGVIGLQQENCFDIQVPEQVLSQALAGGGKQDHYILESELAQANTLKINAKGLQTPSTIAQIETNNELFDENGLDISFG